MNKTYKNFTITTILFVAIILVETLLSEFNPITLLIALTCWIPLLAITIMNEQIISLFSVMYEHNIERDKELIKQIEISYPPAHAFVPVLSQPPANLDIKKSSTDEIAKNESVQTLESLYGDNSVHKNEEK